MTQTYPAYQLTCADMDRLKVVSARIFDRKVSPQSRLEIIARSAGYKTFAALNAALKVGPVYLTGDQIQEERHITEAGLNSAHIPFIKGISINEIISAGLSWPERDGVELAATFTQQQKLESLKGDQGSLHMYLDYLYKEVPRSDQRLNVYRSSLNWEDMRRLAKREDHRSLCMKTAVIMSSPENAKSAFSSFETERPRCLLPTEWRYARIPLPEDKDFFDLPSSSSIPWGSKERVEKLILNARLVVFDEKDLAAVKRQLSELGIPPLQDYQYEVVKPTILFLNEEEDGTFFSLAYRGVTNCDLPEKDVCVDPNAMSDFAHKLLCEMLTVTNSFERERYMLGIESKASPKAWSSRPNSNLVVAV